MSRRKRWGRRSITWPHDPKYTWAVNDGLCRRQPEGRALWLFHMPAPARPSPDGDSLALLAEAERRVQR